MSPAETVRRLFDHFARGDFDGAMELLAEDVEFGEPPDMPDTGGTYHGHDGVRAGFRSFMGAWAELRVDTEELIEAGPDRVIALTRWQGRSRGSEIEVEQRVAQLYVVRDGKVTSVRQFHTREEAEAAAAG